MKLFKPCPLSSEHIVERFDSGKSLLDEWLRGVALYNQQQVYTRTFVIADENYKVVGFQSLCAGIIHRQDVPRKIKGKAAPAEIPIALIARLAVDKKYQGKGLGAVLLRNALISLSSVSQVVAFRAAVVHPLDSDSESFYAKHGFVRTKGIEGRMILSVEDILASIKSASSE